jgi:phage-related protein
MIQTKTSVKILTDVFFATENGAEPVRNWLRALADEDQKRIGDDIRVVEFGWPIGMPVCRPLGKGLYEVRTSLRDRIARVLFTIDGDEMVLLHGFIKKSQATPETDLTLARTRLKKWHRS